MIATETRCTQDQQDYIKRRAAQCGWQAELGTPVPKSNMFQQLTDYMISSTSTYWLLAGDFQASLEEMDALQPLLGTAQAFDPLSMPGADARPPTCLQGKGTTIDHIVASRTWAPLWTSATTSMLSSFPTQRPVIVTWGVQCTAPCLDRCVLPHPIPEQYRCKSAAELQEGWDWSYHAHDFQISLQQADSNAAYREWSCRWEHLFEWRALQLDECLPQRCKGRATRTPWN